MKLRSSPAVLRLRKRPILLLIYIPLLVIPWVLTCVLVVRPLTAPSYLNQTLGISKSQYEDIIWTLTIVRTLTSVASVLTVPVIGAVLAQAAVVYGQRRHRNQSLSIRQVFVLADRGWADIPTVVNAMRPRSGAGSVFFWLAMLLTVISVVQQPLQQILIRIKSIEVVSCSDVPYFACDPYTSKIVAYDVEPSDIAVAEMDLVTLYVTQGLRKVTAQDLDSMIWPTVSSDIYRSQLGGYTGSEYNGTAIPVGQRYFLSMVPFNTTTGILRQHALRMNSSLDCNSLPRDEFPRSCPGLSPFTNTIMMDAGIVSICVPGQQGLSPWESNRNRQEVAEELFLDVSASYGNNTDLDFTLHCQAQTTRGYFELGNVHTKLAYGNLLDRWPSKQEEEEDFNEYAMPLYDRVGGGWLSISGPPLEDDPIKPPIDNLTSVYPSSWKAANGPLMHTAEALFGNRSVLYLGNNISSTTATQLADQFCYYGDLPFGNIIDMSGFEACAPPLGVQVDLGNILLTWLKSFEDIEMAITLMNTGIYTSNKATLEAAVTGSPMQRSIWTAPGVTISKPSASVASITVISILIALQIMGLVIAVMYASYRPTWTNAFDAFAVARLGASIRETELPPLREVSDEDVEMLTEIDGVVGFVENEDETEGMTDDKGVHQPLLGLGAPGIVKSGMTERFRQRMTQ